MTSINAYLSFKGNCREAMTFYKECLGGELVIHGIEGSPVAEHMPPEAQKGVMHASLTNGSVLLMASDMGPENPIKGNTVALMLNCGSEEEIDRLFSSLSAGGDIQYPLADSFWGSKFGQLVDKYGFCWMLNFEKSPPA